MDIKQLKYLIALDETRHFGKAASQCNITQPTLSMRIRNLEEELGLVLIARGQRFEGFTPEGERILAWARALLAAHDGLQAEAALCKGQVVGELRLGMVPLASVDPMIFIRQLTQKYPELTYSLYSMSSAHIADGVSRNQLELGICYLNSIDTSLFDIIQLPETKMGLLHDIRHFQLDPRPLTPAGPDGFSAGVPDKRDALPGAYGGQLCRRWNRTQIRFRERLYVPDHSGGSERRLLRRDAAEQRA